MAASDLTLPRRNFYLGRILQCNRNPLFKDHKTFSFTSSAEQFHVPFGIHLDSGDGNEKKNMKLPIVSKNGIKRPAGILSFSNRKFEFDLSLAFLLLRHVSHLSFLICKGVLLLKTSSESPSVTWTIKYSDELVYTTSQTRFAFLLHL